MRERLVAVLSFVAANVTVADTDTITPPCTVAATDSVPSANPFLWVPYVLLAVFFVGLFGVSFAWYHIHHRHSHTARVHTARLQCSRVTDPGGCRPWMITGSEMATTSWSHMPKYATSGDMEKVLASIYQKDRKHLLGPDGKMLTQQVDKTTSTRRVSSSADEGSVCAHLCLPDPYIVGQPAGHVMSQREALKSPSTSSLLTLSLDPPQSTRYRSKELIF